MRKTESHPFSICTDISICLALLNSDAMHSTRKQNTYACEIPFALLFFLDALHESVRLDIRNLLLEFTQFEFFYLIYSETHTKKTLEKEKERERKANLKQSKL